MSLCERRSSSRECFLAGDMVRCRAASSRAPGFQVVAPGERGEAARALGTAVARALHHALKAWLLANRAAWEAAVTR
jgi:hypothetical protein